MTAALLAIGRVYTTIFTAVATAALVYFGLGMVAAIGISLVIMAKGIWT